MTAPAAGRYAHDLAEAQTILSTVIKVRDRDAAIELARRAVASAEQWSRAAPSDPERQTFLARTQYNLALVLTMAKSNDEGIASYERAAEILQTYARQDLAGGVDRNLLANIYNNLSGSLRRKRSGRPRKRTHSIG